jgi:hypothetical protein
VASRLALLILAVALIPPATASAGEIRKEGALLVYQGHASLSDGVRLSDHILPPRIEFLRLTSQPLTIDASANAACDPDGADRVSCTFAALGAITRVYLLGGSDYDRFESRFSPYPVTVRSGAGGDEIYAGPTDDELEGGAGADFIDGWSGDDQLWGETGRDTLRGNTGTDLIDGGAQFDRADYAERAAGVTVTIGTGADDGEPGEHDTVAGNVEDIAGGSGPDHLVGTAGSNELIGGTGDDELLGGEGFDSLVGGPGADRLLAQDGHPDQLNCADGADTAFADAIDALSECEAVEVSTVLQPDRDADGLNAPIDCDDTRSDVRPGAGDVPDNGVDEDCSGGDATNPDRDGDGFLRPEDCDDVQARVNPGAAEIPGNRIDDDCDGRNPSFERNAARVRNAWAIYRDGTESRRLTVSGLLAPARVELRCRGGGCPRASARKRFKAGRSARPINLRKALGRARLEPGAVVTVRIVKAGQLTKIVRYAIRALEPPKARTTCLAPGTRKERTC